VAISRKRQRRVPLIRSETEDQAAARLRLAFSGGPTPAAAALFLRERDAGLDWESATAAVAEGTAKRFGVNIPPVRPSSSRVDSAPYWPGLGLGVLLYLLARPALSFARELAVAGLASGLRTFVGSGVWQPLISATQLDPIYTGVAIRSIGGVRVHGLSIAGPVGLWLYSALPGLFVSPELVQSGAFASMVAAPGANVLGRATASFGADILVLLLGVVLTSRAGRRAWLGVFGMLLQAETVLGHLINGQVGARQLDAAGLPFAIALVFPTAGWWSTEQLAGLPPVWQAIIVGLSMTIAAYAIVFLVLFAARVTARLVPRQRFVTARRESLPRGVLALSAVVAVATIGSPLGSVARGASNWQRLDQSANWDILHLGANNPPNPVGAAPGQTHSVRIAQTAEGRWQYLVDGHPKVIRGVGYNPQYAALPTTQRARVYQRDFSAIRSVGANTIEGWFENQFDEVTLASAAQNGLGVILPFELNQDWDYSDPVLQTDILARVSDWVVRYRGAPALRMWAPGNENIHRVLYPQWVSQEQVPAARARAQAFAAFLPRLVDRIHELDPNHPVLYRDAEDVYLGWLRPGFETSEVTRPWLVYGANVYSETRLDEIIARWPDQWIGGPLLISEFGPAGRGPDARAVGYLHDWQRIRARPGVVLGGLAYTWATNGPEDLDRVFGLVDADGKPTDAALSALAAAYLNDRAVGDPPLEAMPAQPAGKE